MSFRMLHKEFSLAQNGRLCATVVVDPKRREYLKLMFSAVRRAHSFLEAS